MDVLKDMGYLSKRESANTLLTANQTACIYLFTDCGKCVTNPDCKYCMDGTDEGVGSCIPSTFGCSNGVYQYHNDTTCGLSPPPANLATVNTILLIVGICLFFLVFCPTPNFNLPSLSSCITWFRSRRRKKRIFPDIADATRAAQEEKEKLKPKSDSSIV